MFYPLPCASFAIKACDHRQDFHFYHKTKCKAADKTLEQYFLKEFKASCKNSGESEPNYNKKQSEKSFRLIVLTGRSTDQLISQPTNDVSNESTNQPVGQSVNKS